MPQQRQFDIVGLGHAMVDLLFPIEDDTVLSRLGFERGGAHPLDPEASASLMATARHRAAGGSIANSLAIASALGGTTAFVGSVAMDEYGHAFIRDMVRGGVAFRGVPVDPDRAPTGHCIILVSPDGERTMSGSLGASRLVAEHSLDPALLDGARLFVFDGYFLEEPETATAAAEACLVARRLANPPLIATSLADAGCVRRNAKAFFDHLEDGLDVLFANEREILALTGAADVAAAMTRLDDWPDLMLFVTAGAAGAYVRHRAKTTHVPAKPVTKVVDTTGAGDAFAGGVLFALSQGRAPAEAAVLGVRAAAAIITQMGARPSDSLAHLAAMPNRAA